MKVDRYKNHNIEVVVDRLKLGEMAEGTVDERLRQSVSTAMKQGEGLVMILDNDTNEAKFFSKRLMDPVSGLSYKDPAPNIFSFNSPEACVPAVSGNGTSERNRH